MWSNGRIPSGTDFFFEAVAVRDEGQTDMGGACQTFLTTHWSLIKDIQAGDAEDRALIGLLLERYWKPVYCYVRRKGYDNERAKDLTQGFFHQIVLNRHLVQRADQSKGRFRSFLLHSLNQYIINENTREAALKRIPKDKLVPLDAVDEPAIPQAVLKADPEDSYNYAWMSALIDQVLEVVRTGCRDEGLETHWHIFNERVVQPLLHSVDPPALGDICAKYAVENPRQASNMIVTVKRRFRSALRARVRTTVLSDDQVDDELQEISRFLPDGAQDSK